MASQMSDDKPVTGPGVKIVEPVDQFTALAVRGTIIATGLLGLTFYVKNSRLFAKYRHIKYIPKQYYQNDILLKGVVREITPHGLFKVEHQPVVSISRLLGRKSDKKANLLNLRLAGLEISPEGLSYLTKDLRLPNRVVNFGVVKPAVGNSDAADAVINLKKKFLTHSNLNVDLVRKGFARVLGPEDEAHIDALRTNANYSRLITRLLTCERVADRRGVGVWERSTWVESLQSLPASFSQIVKASAVTKLLLLLFDIVRDLVFISISVVRQGYYLGVATVSYTADVYRGFARGVDRVSTFYAVQKSRFTKGGQKPAAIDEKK